MREQAIAQKVGNRSGYGGGRAASAQRPVRRTRGQGGEGLGDWWRGAVHYLPLVLKVTVLLTVGVLGFVGYRAAATASFFKVRNVEVQGLSRAALADVQGLIRREVGQTGVWNADLPGLSNKLEHLPWVQHAVVSRVLPDGIRVRVTERVPQAVVRTAAGRLRWVDEDAVLLGELNASDTMPDFFLRGLNEDLPPSSASENVERVRKFLELQRDCKAAGISERISEVNLQDLRDMRAQLAGNDSQIEIRLGSQDASTRLKRGIEVLDEQRQTARGQFISYIDLSQGRRAVIGFTSGAHVSAAGANEQNGTAARPAETAERRQ
jgi:cell division septal protein FtsQ